MKQWATVVELKELFPEPFQEKATNHICGLLWNGVKTNRIERRLSPKPKPDNAGRMIGKLWEYKTADVNRWLKTKRKYIRNGSITART